MKKLLFNAVTTVEEFTNLQLKAYYLGNIDKNLNEVIQVAYPELASSVYFSFPEWMAPACSLGAAAYVVGKALKSIWKFLKNQFKK